MVNQVLDIFDAGYSREDVETQLLLKRGVVVPGDLELGLCVSTILFVSDSLCLDVHGPGRSLSVWMFNKMIFLEGGAHFSAAAEIRADFPDKLGMARRSAESSSTAEPLQA